ncbi:MAG: phosphatidate cytidylyltransferase [Candidatus Eremiobacteraeota bacterium]|nr:phosphatidate cytidylyltransferase [Candidatus Eremiobacteraeota bacterium]MBV8720572.1 phosphatidate cytidylyltransferase [Candidatus Eremiobacteraeota bacterium]
MDHALLLACGGILVLLAIASVIGWILRAAQKSPSPTIDNLNQRINAWWVMCLVFGLTLAIGPTGSLVLFGLLSFLALREYVTLIETRRADHRTLFWTFFLFTPLQYYLLSIKWTGFFIVIPVYAFLFIPATMALAGDTKHFLERAAKIQWGLMICVYCLSYAPALLLLQIHDGYGPDAKLLLYLVIVCQLNDVLQYVYGKLFGRRKIAPLVSPNKTWEGFVGGTLTVTAIGAGLWWLTPFTPGVSAVIALTVALLGFAGGLVMSSIKRDRGVKDFGAIIQGHGGILDRMDSVIFAAPVFFHIVRFFYGL